MVEPVRDGWQRRGSDRRHSLQSKEVMLSTSYWASSLAATEKERPEVNGLPSVTSCTTLISSCWLRLAVLSMFGVPRHI